jgi:hypothetical protein
MVASRLESQGQAAMFEQEDSHIEIDDALDQLIFWASQPALDCLKFSPKPEASQEQVCSRVSMPTSQLETQGEAATFEPKACHGEIGDTLDGIIFGASQCKTNTRQPSLFMSDTEMSQGNFGGTLDGIVFKPLQGMIGSSWDYVKLPPEPVAEHNMISTKSPSFFMSQSEMMFQGEISSSSDYLKLPPEPAAVQNMISTKSPSFFMSQSDMTFQGEISSSSDYLRFLSEPEALQGTIGSPSDYLNLNPEPEAVQNNTNTTPTSLSEQDFLRFWPEPEATQKISGTSDYLKTLPGAEALQRPSTTTPPSQLFEPEVHATQGESETATFNWDQMTENCAAPAPSHYYGMTDLDDSYWRGNNNNMVSCCRSVDWFVGTPPTVCSTAGFPISPSVCGGLALWSC